MKKFVFLLVALFSLSIVSAQTISIGAKAGVNYGATLTSDADYNDHFNAMIGPHFGVVADIALTDDFSFQPELLFSPSGSKIDGTHTFMGVEMEYDKVSVKVNYLTIPVMAKYYFVDGFSLEAGPYVGFVVSAKKNGSMTNPLGTETYDNEDIKDRFNSLDYGLGVGASYALEMGVFFTARYNMGLSDINAEDLSAIPVTAGILDKEDTIKNNIFQFSIGYKFM